MRYDCYMKLNHELLTSSERYEQIRVHMRALGYTVLSDVEQDAITARLLEHVDGPYVWVFAYGSLMWNPVFEVVQSMPVTLPGYSRSFCIIDKFARGSRDCPGLMLALKHGGVAAGMALQIHRDQLSMFVKRELISDIYTPEWVRAESCDGELEVLSLVARTHCQRHVGAMSMEEQAQQIVKAQGSLGSNKDYLFDTRQKLKQHGIVDEYIEALYAVVISYPTNRGR